MGPDLNLPMRPHRDRLDLDRGQERKDGEHEPDAGLRRDR